MSARKSKTSSMSQNEGVLAEPEMSCWPMLLRTNQALRDYSADHWIGRAELLEQAGDYTRRVLGLPCVALPTAGPIVVTGHQAVWHHCGIWAKTLACSRLARAVRGTGVQLVLDHDIDCPALAIPQLRPDGWWDCRRISIKTDGPNGPLECRRPRAAAIEQFIREVTAADADQFCNVPWRECSLTRGPQWDRFRSLADTVTYLQALLNVALEVDNLLYLPVSRLCETRAFLMFVLSIFANAMYFARYYNDAVAGQSRGGRGVDKHGIRPLTIDIRQGRTELPFWLVRPDGDRSSLLIDQGAAGASRVTAVPGLTGRLDAASIEDRVRQLKALLERHHWALRPKAVTLTLFARLHLADWFIHGMGGAAYEPVADRLIRNYYSMKPPRYGVITCTAMLPRCRGAGGPTRDLSGLRHRLHHVQHNPELCLEPSQGHADRIRRLVAAKRRQVIRAGDRGLPALQRKAAWQSIALINRQLRRYAGPKIRNLGRQMMQARAERASCELRAGREYFFGLFPPWRLRQVMEVVTFPASVGTATSSLPRARGATQGKEHG